MAGYNPPGVVFPVSAVIMREIDSYKRVLESYSRPLLEYIDWQPTEQGNVTVLNETARYYRYFDATAHAEFLYHCVATTVEHDLPEEVAYLEGYDRFATEVQHIVDLPARKVELLHRFLHQGEGRLSRRAREKEFAALTAEEVGAIERLYAEECVDNASAVYGRLLETARAMPPTAARSPLEISTPSRPTLREEMIAMARNLATPIDVEALVARGVVAKRGAWYEVLDEAGLPENAVAQIRDVKLEPRPDGTQRKFVKLPRVSREAIRLYRELTGKDAPAE